YWADGRSGNPCDAGRHSLEARDRERALQNLQQLDCVRAVDLKRADPAILREGRDELLPIGDGAARYLEYVSRPAVVGGAGKTTHKRYRPVFDKFEPFAQERGVRYWQSVTRQVLEAYAAWL